MEEQIVQNTEALQVAPVEVTPAVPETKEALQAETKVEEVNTTSEPLAATEAVSVEETKSAEVLSDAPKVEETKVEKEELSKEVISEKIEKTKEELSVIKEVRDELVNIYALNRELEASKESLSKETASLKLENEQLKSQLQKYKEEEEKLSAKLKQDRLEKLSANFKALGRDWSVEQLSTKDEETLREFEVIVSAAIEKLEETKEIPAVTTASQAEPVAEAKPVEVVPEKPVEIKQEAVVKRAPTTEQFFAQICNDLQKEQGSNGYHKVKLF